MTTGAAESTHQPELAPEVAVAVRVPSNRTSVLVLVAALLLFLVPLDTRSDGLILGNDVVPYAHGLVEGTPAALWNPHHLLFHPLAALVAKVGAVASGGELDLERALGAHRLLSALGGACAVLVVFRFAFRRCGLGAAVAFAALFALSSGTWLYASVGETYLPATAALGALLVTAAAGRLGWGEARPLSLVGWLVLALLLRQDSVLVVPALFFLVRPGTALAVVSAAGGLAASLYAGAWVLSGTELGFVAWLRGLADSGLFGGGLDLQGLRVSLALLGASLSFATFYASTGWKLGLGVAAAALLLSLALPARRPPGSRGAGETSVALGLGVFVLTRFLFIAWWQPANLEYHAGSILPILLGVLVLWSPGVEGGARRLRSARLAACLLIVGLGNLLLLVLPVRAHGLAEHAAAAVDRAGGDGLVVSIDRLFHYALLREEPPGTRLIDASDAVHGIDPAALPAIRAAMVDTLAAGGGVIVARDVVLPEFWELEAPIPTEGLGVLVASLEVTPVEDATGRVWAFQVEQP